MPTRTLLALAASLLLSSPTLADDKEKEKDKPSPGITTTTEHTFPANTPFRYRATAALTPLNDDALKIRARIFNVIYERITDDQPKAQDGSPLPAPTLAAADPSKRPITFAFNGGPGSSSVWLHMGALGPKRVAFGPEGERLPLPALADNQDAWLPFTDLVFIDPVSTGFSRASDGEDPKQFHGVDEDARAVAEFIRAHLTRTNRWLSPVYLVGESYGTTRAAALSGELQSRHGVTLSGIVLVSPVLNFQTISFDQGNDTPYWLFLPSFTATAFHHKKLPTDLATDFDATLAKARQWAGTDYLTALALGDVLPAERKAQVAKDLARFTGLSELFVLRANLRVGMQAFAKELLREQNLTVGRFDSRYTGTDKPADGNDTAPDYDPSYAVIQAPFTGALNAHLRGTLKFESDRPYEILTGAVQPWNHGSRNRYTNVSETLRAAMTQNPSLRVWVPCGYYDLATPFFAAEHTASHLGLAPAQRANLTITYYKAGHMMYLRDEDRRTLAREAAAFYAN